MDLEDKDRTARLHRVQSNPGDRGVTWELVGQVVSHNGWSGPRQNGKKACDLRGDRCIPAIPSSRWTYRKAYIQWSLAISPKG